MKRLLKWALLLTLTFAFASPLLALQKIDKIAIFTAQVSWTDVATANAAAQKIIDNLKITRDINIMSDADIGKFATANTDDGNLDIIITFGWFPTSVYPPGNAKIEKSVGELFLEGGDMFINSADYIFYVSNPNNDAGGLQNMTDSNFDMWTDGTVCKPNDTGKKYTPSLPASYNAPRCFRSEQIEANKEWELEVAFGDNGATNSDPAVIHNLDYDGRIAIVFQVGDATPRGEVITQLIDNWLREKVKAQPVELKDKLSGTWGKIKRDI